METPETHGEAADELLTLELRIARRADELARGPAGRAPSQLECWLEAEAEVFRGVADTWCRGTGARAEPA